MLIRLRGWNHPRETTQGEFLRGDFSWGEFSVEGSSPRGNYPWGGILRRELSVEGNSPGARIRGVILRGELSAEGNSPGENSQGGNTPGGNAPAGNSPGGNPHQTIRDHGIKTGRDIKIDNFKVCHLTGKMFLKVSEIILIRKFSHDLNTKDSSIKLNILS